MQNPDIQAVKKYLMSLQNSICEQLAQEDGGAVFDEDNWEREVDLKSQP